MLIVTDRIFGVIVCMYMFSMCGCVYLWVCGIMVLKCKLVSNLYE